MNCDTLIIGSGYASVGYAAAHEKTLICEEHAICDAAFYLPLRSFEHIPYEPKTDEGAKLKSIFDGLGLFKEDRQNTNGFECAICKYIADASINVLLKCAVVDTKKQPNGSYDVTVQTNEGLLHIFAKKILDVRKEVKKKRMTVLFISDGIEKDASILLSEFQGASVEPAFYGGRYALHVSLEKENALDENTAKLFIYQKWKELEISAKILYIAPVFFDESKTRDRLSDTNYSNPIEAFEQGFLYSEEKNI